MAGDSSAAKVTPLEQFRWRLPEYWMLALSGTAWLALAARAGVHIHRPRLAASWWHWMLMVAAMMLPLKIDGVRLTVERSLWPRRHRAAAGYLLGYLSVWAVAGILLAWIFSIFQLGHRLDWRLGAAIGFVLEAAWLISVWKAGAERLCHVTVPLAPAGWRADVDCLTYGGVAGLGCATNCWPLMLICWLTSHSFVVMIFSFVLGWSDRHANLDRKVAATVTLMLAAAFGLISQLR